MLKRVTDAAVPGAGPLIRAASGVLGRQRAGNPELSAVITSDVPIVHPFVRDIEPFSRPDFLVMDVPLSTIHLATVALMNTGTQPLERDKFHRPLQLVFEPAPVAILRVTAAWRRPDQLTEDTADPIDITNEGTGVITLRPDLINPGDGFIIRVVLAQTKPVRIGVRLRYPGVDRVETLRFGAPESAITFANMDVEARQLSWLSLRKFAPRRLRFRRAAQLRDLVNNLATWKED